MCTHGVLQQVGENLRSDKIKRMIRLDDEITRKSIIIRKLRWILQFSIINIHVLLGTVYVNT